MLNAEKLLKLQPADVQSIAERCGIKTLVLAVKTEPSYVRQFIQQSLHHEDSVEFSKISTQLSRTLLAGVDEAQEEVDLLASSFISERSTSAKSSCIS